MMTISFDIDGTLASVESMQKLVKVLRKSECRVIILTARHRDKWENRQDFKDFLSEFDMTMQDVIFTNQSSKHEFIEANNIDLHFDDDQLEVELINEDFPGRAVRVHSGSSFS